MVQIPLGLNAETIGIAAAIAAALFLAKWIASKFKSRVPADVQAWLNKISWSFLRDAYLEAELRADTDNTKRDFFIDLVQTWVAKELNTQIPDHIANFLVEYTVAIMKA